MCAEITHKVMRQQSLLDVLTECYRRGGDYRVSIKIFIYMLHIFVFYFICIGDIYKCFTRYNLCKA